MTLINSEVIWQLVDARRGAYEALSDRVWEMPEIAYTETRSVAEHRAMLQAEGFRITDNVAGIPTAILGEAGEDGPVIAILGEYDALPGLSQVAGIAEPKPLVPGGFACPVHCSALRSDPASTVSVPSIIALVRLATVPSNATFSGALDSRALRPERSPDRAAMKSETLMAPSTRSPCQSNCPVAANEREIDGQASERSMSSSLSEAFLSAS